MSPFLIFAISLTIAYAIYYAVMITRDLYGKKEEAKSNEEVFDISNITEEEAAVAINESDGGFSVADKQYDTSFQDGTSYDEGYGMGTENNGMSGYSPETDSSGREDDVDEDEGNNVNQQKPKNAAESLQEKMAGMHDYVVTMMLYVLYLTYAVAAVMVIISALQIYIKMNTGEDGVTKSILTLIGACLFMIGASILFPAFFGYQI